MFPVDSFDFMSLMLHPFSNAIMQKYGCSKLDGPSPSGNIGLVFSPGKFEVEGKTKVIDRIIIEARRIIVTVGGSSDDARILMKDIIFLIASFDTRHEVRPINPVIEIDESQSIVKLAIDFHRLLSGSISANVPKALGSLTNVAPSSMRVSITPSALRFKIHYSGENEDLQKHLISMADKYISIEVREGTAIEECIFFVSAPIKSDSLFELLRSIENGG